MLRIVIPTVLCVAALVPPLTAQRGTIRLDASAGTGSGAQRAAVAVWYSAATVAGRLHLGLGIRASAYAGDPIAYTNREIAQAGLAPSVTIDPAVYGINGAVFGELSLFGAAAFGANLDLAGLATGPLRTAGSLRATPQTASYFQNGDADHGALNSEFFLLVRVAPRVQVRAGVSHYVTDYVVTDAAAGGSPGSRYQKFQTVPFVAVGLRL